MSRKKLAPVAEVAPVVEAPAPNVGKNGRLQAIGLPCLCGCGDATRQPAARFLPGHDAKLRAAIRKAKLGWDSVPEIARPFFIDDQAHGEATAGLLMVPGTNGFPLLRDVKAERRVVPVADDAREVEMASEIAELKAALELAKRSA